MRSCPSRGLAGRRKNLRRRGAITILAALLAIVLLGMVAFAVDIGYVLSSKEELQRTADSAALAACWEYSAQLAAGTSAAASEDLGRDAAAVFASANPIANQGPALDPNYTNSADGDIQFGYISDFDDPHATMNTGAGIFYNAVRVKINRNDTRNGELPLFFARVFGHDSQAIEGQATAAIVRDVKGFQVPSGGGNLDILPYALDEDTWNEWMAGNADDDWSWNTETGEVECGPDGFLEVNLFPQGTGSPGNRGTVDIGSSNNSTSDIARQILYGISPEDMAYHNGTLEFNSCGYLILNGDTGISAGVKDELNDIKGQPRIIPVFSQVTGPGNNADYKIVKWFGIRIVHVKLTGPMSKKHVTIQAAPVVTKGVIPATEPGPSSYVYSPAVLIH